MTQPPDGYYALPDPANPDTMTYWRATDGRLTMWPAKAWHGPARPLKRDAPADPEERIAWLRSWFDRHDAWLRAIQAAIEADPGAGLRRFAELSVRCCQCGRTLTDSTSKVVGIGPECRRGLSPDLIALIGTPAVAAAHAAHASTAN